MSLAEKPVNGGAGEDLSTEESLKSRDALNGSPTKNLKLDRHGLPLNPQPLDDPMDPLNWSPLLKFYVLGMVSLLSFMALMSASLITPTFIVLSKYLHKGITTTAYVTSFFVLFVGISSIVFNPIANVYGRRPVYIICVAGAMAFSVASGKATSFGSLLGFRMMNGFFGGVPLGLGSATVADIFFTHERGFYMGIYTVSFITGGHIAPIIGGYIEEALSWRWCFYVPAMITAGLLVLFIFTVPETLYSRAPEALARRRRTLTQNLMMTRLPHPTRKLKIIDFFRPIQLLKYPNVLIPAAYYMTIFTYASILFIITSASLFAKTYHFHSISTGLLLGIPITIGSVIGECISGALADQIAYRRAVSRGGQRKSEDVLLAMIPAFVLVPLGIIIEGVCLEHKTHWIGTAFGIAIGSVGLQIATTPIYAYTTECYKPQAAEIGTVLNLSRQIYSFAMGFYALPLAEEINVQDAWITFAFVTVAFSLPVIVLIFKGEGWRRRFGQPSWHQDL